MQLCADSGRDDQALSLVDYTAAGGVVVLILSPFGINTCGTSVDYLKKRLVCC